MSTTTLLILGAFAALFVWRVLRMQVDPAQIAAAHDALARGAALIDVRSPAEFRGGHVPGAKNLPLQSLRNRMGEIGPKDREVVVYCASGSRSGSASSQLRAAGFASVIDAGAMRNLSAAAAQPATQAAATGGLNRQQRRAQQRQQRQQRRRS